TLDYASYTTAVTMNLQSKKATGIGGLFANIEAVTGGSAPTNTLTGANKTNTWTLTGTDAGDVSGFTFAAMPNLTGGAGIDTVTLNAGQKISGKIDGGAGTSDVLDYAAFTTALTINLQARTATNTGGFLNLEQFVGGTIAKNTIIAPNLSNAWSLSADN